MRNGFSIYDTHAHLGSARHSGRRHKAEDLLRAMDGAGVDRALLIPFPVVDDHRREHDEVAAAVRAHPDRFAGCACLPPYLPDEEFQGELRRCVETLGLRALKLQPQYHGLNPLSERAEFYFAQANAYRLPVVVHTGAGAPFALPSLYIAPARQFPELPIVLGHAGGGIYALEAAVAAMVCPNIYVELSSLTPHHIVELLRHVPPERLMVGSDLPESLETETSKVLTLPIEDASKRAILWDTARRIFDRVG